MDVGSKIDVSGNRYPFCVVWGLLPPLTFILPWVGHMGICDSSGQVHDFAGPYTIGIDNFMTGKVMMYLPMEKRLKEHLRIDGEDPPSAEEIAKAWDHAIAKADEEYRSYMVISNFSLFILH